MSTYYSSRVGYIIEDFQDKKFDFESVRKEIMDKLNEINDTRVFWNTIKELRMTLTITAPDMEALMLCSKIKSHEFTAVLEKVADMVKSSIAIVASKIAHTISYYKHLKRYISIRHIIEYTEDDLDNSQRKDIIIMNFSTKGLEIEDIIAFFNLWDIKEFTLATSIKIEFHTIKKGVSIENLLLSSDLEKKELVELQDFLTIEDSKVLQHPAYFKILKNYMFPEGYRSRAEITLDMAQENLTPKKRRTITYDKGRKGRFHEVITKLTPFTKYQEIIKENNISGIYCSVRSTNNEILYMLIDIDVPSLFFKMFPKQIVWDLILNIADALKSVVSRLGLPRFRVNYSGSKGIHIYWALESEAIADFESRVNLPELSSNSIPGMRTLKREKISSLKDSFKFTKTLLQSILLHTVYQGKIKIPTEIVQKLKIYHPYQIFKLSPDSKNLGQILLDCSSQSKGVFRLFSPHPSSRKISIPLSDFNIEGVVLEKYRNYQEVLNDAKIENVLERFDKNEIDLYLQSPKRISRMNLRQILHPDKLFPTFAILLRFGVMYSIERSPPSYSFWRRFYELKSFYEYVEKSAYFHEEEFSQMTIEYIESLALNLNIRNSENIAQVLVHYMIEKKIGFPIAQQLISNLYYREFFFDLKSNIFLRKNQDNLLTLFSEQMQFSNFLSQAEHLFNLSVHAVITLIISKYEDLPEHKRLALEKFNNDNILLLDLNRVYLSELRSNKESLDKEQQLIDTLYFITRLYFSSIVFLNDFYNIQEETQWK